MADVSKVVEVLRELLDRLQAESSLRIDYRELIDKLDAEQLEQRRCVPSGLMARCRVCGQTWTFVDERPICKGAPAEPPKRRMRHHLGKNTTSTHHTWEPHDEIFEGHPTIESCTRCGCQPVPDAATSPIWERMEQNSATVAAMPDYVKGSPKNERGVPSPRAWVCVEDPNGDHGIYLDGDTVMMRLLPLPTAKELGKVAWKWGTNMQGTDEQFEKLGAVLYWALGVSERG